MSTPPLCIPFVILEDNELHLNEKVLQSIRASTNPHIILFSGPTRTGKSTTMNNILHGCSQGKYYQPKERIFDSAESARSVTRGCNVYGPIKLSALLNKNDLVLEENDSDLFFIDSEGFNSLNGLSPLFYPSVLTLLQVCTSSINFSRGIPTSEELNSISMLREVSEYMKLMIPFELPKTLLYCTSIPLQIPQSVRLACSKFQQYGKQIMTNISQAIEQNNLNPDLIEQIQVISGGPYFANDPKEPETDVCLTVYWDSLQQILQGIELNILDRQDQDGIKLVKLIEALFMFFKRFKTVPKITTDFKAMLKDVLVSQFQAEVDEQVGKILQELENDLTKCIEIAQDQNAAHILVTQSMDPDKIVIYNRVISENVKSILTENRIQLNEKSQEIINNTMNTYCQYLESDASISEMTSEIVTQIRSYDFREDVDPNLIAPEFLASICDKRMANNDDILNYMQRYQKQRIHSTVASMQSKVNTVIQDAYLSLKEWSTFLKNNLNNISEEVRSEYQTQYNKCSYFEDFEQFVPKPDQYSNQIQSPLIQKYFSDCNLNDSRTQEVINLIGSICQTEYQHLNQTNFQKWADIKDGYRKKADKEISKYIDAIIGNHVRDDINLDKGTLSNLLNQIKILVPIEDDVKGQEKIDEIELLLENIAIRNVDEFASKLIHRPILLDVLKEKRTKAIQLSAPIVDEYLKKCIYSDAKPVLTVDQLYGMIIKQDNFFKDYPEKEKEIKSEIMEVCQNQINSYNNQASMKQSFEALKMQCINTIDIYCQRSLDQYQTIDKEVLKTEILNSPNFFRDIPDQEHKDIIISIINEKVNQTFEKIQNAKSVNELKEVIKQMNSETEKVHKEVEHLRQEQERHQKEAAEAEKRRKELEEKYKKEKEQWEDQHKKIIKQKEIEHITVVNNEKKQPNAQLVLEIWQGKWGLGQDRVNRLASAGYDTNAVQNLVNEYGERAHECYLGKYGNGECRFQKLRSMGYNSSVVQSIVNIRYYGLKH
jgi:DNA polymerase III delta prime subunit/outer membrane murein-binding lipoprotein Lpp